jgi:hypothetical protein
MKYIFILLLAIGFVACKKKQREPVPAYLENIAPCDPIQQSSHFDTLINYPISLTDTLYTVSFSDSVKSIQFVFNRTITTQKYILRANSSAFTNTMPEATFVVDSSGCLITPTASNSGNIYVEVTPFKILISHCNLMSESACYANEILYPKRKYLYVK